MPENTATQARLHDCSTRYTCITLAVIILSVYRSIPSKHPSRVSAHPPVGDYTDKPFVCITHKYVNHRIIKKGGWALTRRWALTRENTVRVVIYSYPGLVQGYSGIVFNCDCLIIVNCECFQCAIITFVKCVSCT